MRLIKSEFWKADYDFAKRWIEVYENPSHKDWETVMSDGKDGIRGIIQEDGTLYIWSGKLLHKDAIPLFSLPHGVHFDYIMQMEFYLFPDTGMEYLYQAFSNCDSFFNYLNKNTEIAEFICSYYKVPRLPIYNELKTIGDILNYKELEKELEYQLEEESKEELEKVSRLIESTFVDTYKDNKENYFNCFKNPTKKEWDNIIETDLKEGFRAVITDSGDVYAWNGYLLHKSAIGIFNLPFGVHLSGMPEHNEVDIYIQQGMTLDYLISALNKADSLYTIISRNAKIFEIDTSYYKMERLKEYDEFKTLNDIINYKELAKMNKVSRLLKNAASRYEVKFNYSNEKEELINIIWGNSEEEIRRQMSEDFGDDIIIKSIKKLYT